MTLDPCAVGHVLHLGIDLQIDTLLFTLGVAVADADPDLPWRRWLAEDLDAAVALATDAVRVHVPLPATLTAAGRGRSLVRLDLTARYAALIGLLDDVAAGTADPALRDHLHRVRDRYASRLPALPDPA